MKKINPPLGVSAHRGTPSLTFCWHLQWHCDFFIRFKPGKDHRWTKLLVHNDDKSCAVISAGSWEDAVFARALRAGEGNEMWEGVRQRAVASHAFIVRHQELHISPLCRDSSCWLLHLPLFVSGHHEWDVPLVGRQWNVSVVHSRVFFSTVLSTQREQWCFIPTKQRHMLAHLFPARSTKATKASLDILTAWHRHTLQPQWLQLSDTTLNVAVSRVSKWRQQQPSLFCL